MEKNQNELKRDLKRLDQLNDKIAWIIIEYVLIAAVVAVLFNHINSGIIPSIAIMGITVFLWDKFSKDFFPIYNARNDLTEALSTKYPILKLASDPR